jgi:hypothetical protein
MPVLTGIDLLGIQRYVFASNRLRDVLAASWMVEHVTHREADSLCQWGVTRDRVLLGAGGNAIVEFNTLDDAKTWTAYYTRWVQKTAPGIEVVIAHRPYEGRSLAWALAALQVELARAKVERRSSAPQLGLSVTASCSVTGLPASQVDEGGLVSRRVACLRERNQEAKSRWDAFLPELGHTSCKAAFPDELDLMGRTHGETSVLGVVHVDGNSVGRAIDDWLKRCIDERLDDPKVREQYRQWSDAISNLGEAVLHALVKRTAECVHEDIDEHHRKHCFLHGTPDELGFWLRDWRDDKTRIASANTVFLPLRPILLGGDDLTLVCDGRIAVDLAATALREFGEHPIPHLGADGGETTLTACAGVALVKAHAPFHRSYELAESLCASAKRRRREVNEEQAVDTGCWLDWHAGTTRPGESVEDVRKRQYRHGGNKLTMRPYPIVKRDRGDQSWDWLDRDVLGPTNAQNNSFRGFREDGDPGGQSRLVPNVWSGSRNRVKRLGSLVANGKDEVRRQVEAWGAQLPEGLPSEGFIGPATPLLDAIELLDLHLRLERDPRVPQGTRASATAGVAPKEEG